MSQTEARKYQLFPKENQAMTLQGKGLDPEQAFAFAMGQDGDKADKSHMGSLRVRMREHNLNRRRKVSVPELGPMTTVHESTIDSPTLPGRPPFHERSISAPGNDWRQDSTADRATIEDTDSNVSFAMPAATTSPSEMHSRQPQSPKCLPPLLIPVQTSHQPRVTRQPSQSRHRSGSTGNNDPNFRSPRTDDSPRTRAPYTPVSATTVSSTLTASTLPTPISATADSRTSPQQWKSEVNTTDYTQNMTTPKSAVEAGPKSSANYHRRNVSESSSISGSIMDRGRPRKKVEANVVKRTGSKSSRSAERRAFEALPKGWKAPDAVQMLHKSEVAALQKQAAQQAARFEIMRKEDVDSLSKELRDLDERAEYLRRTYHSLRTGRRNLHSRICQYLRSPRVAKFNHEPMLKQEEALAELDASIDDWVNRLEHTENRRTRIRQKLLEHVAAAVALPASGSGSVSEGYQIALGIAPASAPAGTSTPPRSPVKFSFTPNNGSPSHSPQREPQRDPQREPQRITAHVPSTIPELPVIEEAAASAPENNKPQQQQDIGEKSEDAEDGLTAGIRRAAVESIRIYAGDEVAALLADVEQQMVRMSKAADHVGAPRDKDMSCEERKELHRAHSHEILQGGPQTASSDANLNTGKASSSTPTPRTATPTITETDEEPGGFLLSSAVFNPKTAVAQ